MLKYLLLLNVILCSTIFGQTFQWANLVSPNYQFNPTSLHTPIAIDNLGNPVCARLKNYQQIYSSVVYGDVTLEKRTASGSLIWENTIYGKADISEITLDQENNVICIGTFRDSVIIGTTTLYQTEVNQNSILFKTDASGNFLWVVDGTEFASQYGVITALELKAPDNLLIGVTNYNVNANIYEFDSDGNLISTILQTGAETISDINVDILGNIWTTGFAFNGAVSFNGLDTIAPFTYNDYIIKYNSSGVAQWVSFVEDITVQEFNIETDNSGNGYLSGNLFAPTQFGNLNANGPQWVYDFFVTKIDPDGNYLWLNEIPPGNNTSGDGTIGNSNFLSCSIGGNTFVTGFFRGQIDFGNGVILSANGNDIFVLSYDSDGTIQWGKAAGGDTYNDGCGIVTDNNESCYVSGVVSQNAVFDTISISGEYMNLFIAKLTFGTPVKVENQSQDLIPLANEYSLMQNYPNPFNPSTKIGFVIPNRVRNLEDFSSQASRNDNSLVTLKVYDILGNEIATLVNEEKPAGTYEVNFDAAGLSSGLYFYTLTAGSFSETKKMILLR